MPDKNMEDIDKLSSREGLNPKGDNLAFIESDWSKLKERLNRNEKQKRGIFWLSRLGGVACLNFIVFCNSYVYA